MEPGCQISRYVLHSTITLPSLNMEKNVIREATTIRGMLYPALDGKSPVRTKTKLQICYTYIRSALTYAGRTWGPSLSNTNWKSAEAVQNICLLRTILAVPPHVIGIKPYCTLLQSYLYLQYKNFTYAKNANVQFYENSFSKFKHTKYPGHSTGHPVTERKIRPISHGQKSKFKLTKFSKQLFTHTI